MKKNTSLIICVEVENIEEFNKMFKNSIFAIEEDEYYFRKYVILYSKNGIENLKINENIESQIHSILLSPSRMDEFQKEYFKDEEFFVAMQLMVKLPFLVLKTELEEFESLQDRIYEYIKGEKLDNFFKGMKNFDDNCIKKEVDEYFEELELSFLSEKINGEVLNEFLDNFDEDIL